MNLIAFPVFSATKTCRPLLPQSAWSQETETSALASPFTARRNDVISFSGLSPPRFQVAPGNTFLYDSARAKGSYADIFPHLFILTGFATTSSPRRLASYAGTHLWQLYEYLPSLSFFVLKFGLTLARSEPAECSPLISLKTRRPLTMGVEPGASAVSNTFCWSPALILRNEPDGMP